MRKKYSSKKSQNYENRITEVVIMWKRFWCLDTSASSTVVVAFKLWDKINVLNAFFYETHFFQKYILNESKREN